MQCAFTRLGLPLTSSFLLEYSSEYLTEYSLIPEVFLYKLPMTKKGVVDWWVSVNIVTSSIAQSAGI